MTLQDHNRVIGIMHIVWGAFNGLIMLLLVPFFLIFMGVIGSDPKAPAGLEVIFGFLGFFFLVLALVIAIPSFVAGYAMLKRKSWAKIAGIISACLCALNFPFGTALCVYTLWFVLGEGQNIYGALGAARSDYAPRLPPDWRG